MLSAHRAFLVKVDTEADPTAERFCGRVEHVVSGTVADFESTATLISFIGRVIDEQQAQRAQLLDDNARTSGTAIDGDAGARRAR